MNMIRFTAYRRDMDSRETHNDMQKNPESEPQYEGVIFTDGTVVLRWLTPLRSHSVWGSFEEAMGVHGHPEYGTEIEWHDQTSGYKAWWDRRVVNALEGK
jgi:hypothetical protein